jgi:hypothetical protein
MISNKELLNTFIWFLGGVLLTLIFLMAFEIFLKYKEKKDRDGL